MKHLAKKGKTGAVSDGASTEAEKTDKPEGTAEGADAGAGEPAAEATSPEPDVEIAPGTVALVTKGNERLPVELRNRAHLNELIATHGAGSVEVQS
jgi:hypothetical protein